MEKKGQGKKRRRTRKREIAGKEKEEATERQAEPKGNRKFEKEGLEEKEERPTMGTERRER